MTDVYTPYRDRLEQLLAEVDAINVKVVPIKEELEELNVAAEQARLAAESKALEISNLRGGQRYIDLKKEIAVLSKLLAGKL